MNALAARRRHPVAIALLLMLALVVTGGLYAVLAPKPAAAAAVTADQVAEGKALFRANCASCHGLNAEGSETDIESIAAYIASLGPGPARPDEEWLDWEGQGDAGRGGTIYRSNCAMCHSSAAAGGALTRGKYAPTLEGVEPVHIYEAMLTGPQNMPVFNDANLTPEDKRDVIAYIKQMHASGNPGGMNLGNFGPASEAMFIWIFGLGIMIGAAVWLGQKGA